MKFVFLSLLLFSSFCHAQQTVGIKFEKKLDWKEIKQKAKKENKFIFLDAYTTWCGPCKYMAAKIFPQAQVGDFFNKNFISVSVQIDKTKKDNESIKSWYKDADMIAKTYKINAYPTYLFFNKNGDLVHSITGASSNANDFIAKAKEALNPKTQYSNLKSEYINGKRDSSFLLSLISATIAAGDDSLLHIYINNYFATQNDLLTPQNIKLIAQGTTKSSDIGFNILLKYPKEVEAIIGKEERFRILNIIAFDEEIFPIIMINGKKTVYGGGLSIYGGGEMNKNVNWSAIKTKLNLKYNDLAEQIIFNGKLKYYDWLEDWVNFNNLLLNYTSEGNNVDTALINNMAGKLLQDCKDKKYFQSAINWASILVENKEHPYYLQTYSLLLYKAGENDLAIRYMKEYASLLKNAESINETIKKMKKGEEIE
ncbi:MAG: thioredoxin fold domain-containing protein [Bacteroidota bacterium]|nr:thioredoxin fold domain-containing protein [Bacteroidota bacterium]